MKKLIFLLLLLVIFIQPIFGQYTWNRVLETDSITFIDGKFIDSTGYFIGQRADSLYIWRTHNAGLNWNIWRYIKPILPIKNITFQNTNTFWIVTSNDNSSVISKYTYSAGNFNKIDSIYNFKIELFFVNNNIGFRKHYNTNSLFRTTNGGQNWILVDSIFYISNFSIKNNVIFSLHDNNKQIYRSINFGSTWSKLTGWDPINNYHLSTFSNGLYGIKTLVKFAKFHDSLGTVIWYYNGDLAQNNAYYILSDSNKIFISTYINNYNYCIALFVDNGLNNSYLGITCAGFGQIKKILKSSRGLWAFLNKGIVSTTVIYLPTNINQNSNIFDYQLISCYPNPFNSSMNVKYSLNKQDFVRINLYDINGKFIKTIVNQNQGIGNYEVKFDAVDLPSGIYFVQYKQQIVKLILIK